MKNIIMAVEGEKKRFALLRQAFIEKGFSVNLIPVRGLTIFTDMSGSRVKASNLSSFSSAVYLETPLALAQFVEPLLDYIELKGLYCQVHKKAYYVASNEMLQLSVLNSYNIKIPPTRIFGNIEQIKKSADKFSYPVIVKIYKDGEKIQSMIAKSPEELVASTERAQGNNAIVRECIEGDVDYCAVIGDEVFALRRPSKDNAVALQPMKNARPIRLSKTEEETAIQAASICGCDVATVKLCRGFVLKVKPYVNMLLFTRRTGRNLFEKTAELFEERG